MSKFTLTQLQEEHAPWVLKNFGQHPAWHPLLGMIEELGELAEAMNLMLHEPNSDNCEKHKCNIKDGLGDVIIFMSDFCNISGINLNDTINQCKIEPANTRTAEILIGRIVHSFLKDTQGIRGTHEEHQNNIKILIGELYNRLVWIANLELNIPLLKAVEDTWNNVKCRDWTKNSKTGVDPNA
jgi:NTP pyrophosphatase (non-canonical NTP hydrolase)